MCRSIPNRRRSLDHTARAPLRAASLPIHPQVLGTMPKAVMWLPTRKVMRHRQKCESLAENGRFDLSDHLRDLRDSGIDILIQPA